MVKTEWFIAGVILGGGLVHLWEPVIFPPAAQAVVAVTASAPQCVTPDAKPETVETPGIREILEALPLAIRTTEVGARPNPQPRPERQGRDEIAQHYFVCRRKNNPRPIHGQRNNRRGGSSNGAQIYRDRVGRGLFQDCLQAD